MEQMEVKLVRLCPTCGPTTNYDANLNCLACGAHTKEEVIAGDTGMGPMGPIGPVPVMETTETFQRRKRMCNQYGKEIAPDARFCQYCGIDIPDSRVSESTVTGLAAIGGIFGMHGLGHISLGRMATGFLMLFAGWALIVGAVLSYLKGWVDYGETSYLALIGVLGVAYVFLFVWQVMDAGASARRHNRDYENHKAA